MKIARGHTVTLQVELFDADGSELDVSEAEEVRYVHGDGELFPLLEEALEGAEQGDEVSVRLEPEDAFGPYEAEGLFSVPRETFADAELESGDWVTIEVAPEEGDEDLEEGELEARVVEISDEEVVLDANHPLAGRTVLARARVLSVEPRG